MGFHTELARLQVWFIPTAAAAAAESLQSCPTLCNPIDGSPPGFPIPGKNTAVGCNFLLHAMQHVPRKEEKERQVLVKYESYEQCFISAMKV